MDLDSNHLAVKCFKLPCQVSVAWWKWRGRKGDKIVILLWIAVVSSILFSVHKHQEISMYAWVLTAGNYLLLSSDNHHIRFFSNLTLCSSGCISLLMSDCPSCPADVNGPGNLGNLGSGKEIQLQYELVKLPVLLWAWERWLCYPGRVCTDMNTD